MCESCFMDFMKSAVIPVFIFFLGFGLSQWLIYCKEKKRLKDVKEYFETLVDLECDIAKKQSAMFIECADRLRNINEIEVRVKKVVGLPTKYLNDINKQDLFKIFLERGNVTELTKDFNMLLSQLEIIDNTISVLNRNNKSFMLHHKDLRDKMAVYHENVIVELRKNINNQNPYLFENDKNHYLKTIAQILIKYNAEIPKEKRLSYDYQNVAEELSKAFKNPKFHNDPRSQVFSNDLKKWEHTFNTIVDSYVNKIESCKTESKKLTNATSEITKLLEKLE